VFIGWCIETDWRLTPSVKHTWNWSLYTLVRHKVKPAVTCAKCLFASLFLPQAWRGVGVERKFPIKVTSASWLAVVAKSHGHEGRFKHLWTSEELTVRITLTIAVCEVELSWIWREIHCRWHTCCVKKELTRWAPVNTVTGVLRQLVHIS
jgi:hypothetical protein